MEEQQDCTTTTVPVFQLTCDELTRELRTRFNKGAYHGQALYRHVMQHGQRDVTTIDAFKRSGDLADRVQAVLGWATGKITDTVNEGETIKFVTTLDDGARIESVIIPMRGYSTVCVSSQVGCRQGCVFCETAGMGFVRQLTAEEIVAQVWRTRHVMGHPVRNVVFMGMGEPLDNLDNVMQAIRVMQDQRGLDIPLRRMTLSTSGRVDGLKRLAEAGLTSIRLAISLNAANNELRSRIMPVNKRFPLDQLRQALRTFPLPPNREFFIEYVIFKGVNGSRDHVRDLLAFIRDLPVRVNVIGYNPGRNARFKAPEDRDLLAFAGYLREHGVHTRIRWSKGRSIMAGCGQLAAERGTGEHATGTHGNQPVIAID
ncbi:23S rRNA (adenine(2503)-C(2))-methyltransferase RlmN [Desulfoplanes formicivorans]|uniref:23S rRNA (Adenine(2503)-C(2))-methyltransferase n=1 Tax=Desulfoplanes formicivorans TaxID=1592317 RepID=A0A194AKR3_9BACT|nr:23S rRNA (adenine(2503)-C(2))-methyltransferase RlmN [Desulfoplanes formicivorans]GAU09903.1 23S rRNA (adenine(2503)-C(2))-methyltransferase [Desulfoplanes formicivorans]